MGDEEDPSMTDERLYICLRMKPEGLNSLKSDA